MPGDIDHIVDAAHHEQVAIVVEIAAVTAELVTRMFTQIGRLVPGVVTPERGQRARWQR